jgi:hypothetical protein
MQLVHRLAFFSKQIIKICYSSYEAKHVRFFYYTHVSQKMIFIRNNRTLFWFAVLDVWFAGVAVKLAEKKWLPMYDSWKPGKEYS